MRMNNRLGKPSAILWDLDGTLLDTAADIALALNLTLQECGFEGIPVSQVKTLIGQGARVLLERALADVMRHQASHQVPHQGGIDILDEPTVQHLLSRFQMHYLALEVEQKSSAQFYPKVLSTLEQLHTRVPMAIVTNKPEQVAIACVERVGLQRFMSTVIGSDTLTERKPHPAPLLEACRRLNVESAQALMVGDSKTDWAAATAVPMRVALLPYGYHAGVDLSALEPTLMLNDVAELLTYWDF